MESVGEAEDPLQRSLVASTCISRPLDGERPKWCPCIGDGEDADESSALLSTPTTSSADLSINQVDGKKGWVVVACASVVMVIVQGISSGIGILLKHLDSCDKETCFTDDREALSSIASAFVGSQLLSAPFICILGEKFGYRWMSCTGSVLGAGAIVAVSYTPNGNVAMLVMLYGVIGGVTSGILQLASTIVPVSYFERHLPLAIGLVTTATGVGIVIFSWISPMAFAHLGWRGMLRIQGGTMFCCTILSLAFSSGASQPRSSIAQTIKKDGISLLQKPEFWILSFYTITGMFGVLTNLMFLPTLGAARNIKPNSDYLIAIIGGVTIVARLMLCGLRQGFGISPLLLQAICFLLGGLAMICNRQYTDFYHLAMLATFIGITYGADTCLTVEVIMLCLGKRYVSIAFSLILLCRGIVAVALPPIQVKLYNASGAWILPFQIGGASLIITAMVGSILQMVITKRYITEPQSTVATPRPNINS